MTKANPQLPHIVDARCGLVIDAQYLYRAVKMQNGGKIDYNAFLSYLAEEFEVQLSRIVAIVIESAERDDPGFNMFLYALSSLGIEVVLYKMKKNADGTTRSDCTVQLTTETVLMSQKVDVILLATGNGDYVYLVEKLRALGVRVFILGYRINLSRELKESANGLLELPSDILMPE